MSDKYNTIILSNKWNSKLKIIYYDEINNEWMGEGVNEWIGEWVNEGMGEGVNEGREWMKRVKVWMMELWNESILKWATLF